MLRGLGRRCGGEHREITLQIICRGGLVHDRGDVLGSNAGVADGGIRKVRAQTRFAQQSVPGHSLRHF